MTQGGNGIFTMKKIMIRFCTAVVLMLFSSLSTFADWWQAAAPTTNALEAIATNGNAVLVGDYGNGVFVSTDKGLTWVAKNSGMAEKFILAIEATDSSFYAGTYSGYLYYCRNNGLYSWSSFSSATGGLGVGAFTHNSRYVLVGTGAGSVFSSPVDGANWSPVGTNLGSTIEIRCLAIKDSIVFAGTWGHLFTTTVKGGAAWADANSTLTSRGVNSLAVYGNCVFAGTDVGGVFVSSDNGATWTAYNAGLGDKNIRALTISGNTIFAGAYNYTGGVFMSDCLSLSGWTAVNQGLFVKLTTSLAASSTDLYALADRSIVFRRPRSEMIGVTSDRSREFSGCNSDFMLIAPTRASCCAKISFSLARSERVCIKAYTISGHEIACLADNSFRSGVHTLSWNMRNATAGCYTIRFESGSKTYANTIAVVR
jgi:photosystem II stability/assembly factor-like uncharacterized protein